MSTPTSAIIMAEDERRDLLDLLRTLSAEEWSTPSLCRGWSVKDVAAHMISYDGIGVAGMAGRFLRGRVLWANEAGVDEYRALSTAQLLETFERRLTPTGLTAGLGGMIGLVDGTIHHQDIRRALHRPREIPRERLATVIAAVPSNPRLGARRRIRGLRLVADDIDWSHGRGREVRGSAEAIMMAMSGRADALAELSGPGQPLLADRVG